LVISIVIVIVIVAIAVAVAVAVALAVANHSILFAYFDLAFYLNLFKSC